MATRLSSNAGAAAGGVTITRTVHRTDKSIVASGVRNGQPVFVKMITTGDADWMASWSGEGAAATRIAAVPGVADTVRRCSRRYGRRSILWAGVPYAPTGVASRPSRGSGEPSLRSDHGRDQL